VRAKSTGHFTSYKHRTIHELATDNQPPFDTAPLQFHPARNRGEPRRKGLRYRHTRTNAAAR
jgi:hypothetical protein